MTDLNLIILSIVAAFVGVILGVSGMLTSSGVVLADKDDQNDLEYVVIASVEVGY